VIVIADDLNYIKGFRYQLWCEAKAVGTRCCTIHCAAREDEVEKWNFERLKTWAQANGEKVPQEDPVGTNGQTEGATTLKTMLPESHTAIYGDKIPLISSRSRSSSLDADDGEDGVPGPGRLIEESLKSFSLADRLPVAKNEMHESESPVNERVERTSPTEPSATASFDFPPPTSRPYSLQTLRSLLMRYEPPSPFSRWDTPLFTIPASDAEPPVQAIWEALYPPRVTSFSRRGGTGEKQAEVKPNAATVLPQATGAEALQVLERVTANIVTRIMAELKEQPDLTDTGGEVSVSFGSGLGLLSIPPRTILTLPMLQRLRRRFTQIQRGGIAHGQGYVKGEKAMGEAFLRFLNAEIGS
jgi:tRNA uridine 5-carbamoylmethylation protein Kti12